MIVLSLGDCYSDQHENFHTSTPVLEADGDFVTLIFVTTMWDTTGPH